MMILLAPPSRLCHSFHDCSHIIVGPSIAAFGASLTPCLCAALIIGTAEYLFATSIIGMDFSCQSVVVDWSLIHSCVCNSWSFTSLLSSHCLERHTHSCCRAIPLLDIINQNIVTLCCFHRRDGLLPLDCRCCLGATQMH